MDNSRSMKYNKFNKSPAQADARASGPVSGRRPVNRNKPAGVGTGAEKSSVCDVAVEEKRNSPDADEGPVTSHAELPVAYKSFDDMGLKDDLLRGIYANAFEAPTLIQSRAIVPVIEGRDMISQAQSGTGKTGTFVIGALQRIEEDAACLQALVMAPTRELVNQIGDVVE